MDPWNVYMYVCMYESAICLYCRLNCQEHGSVVTPLQPKACTRTEQQQKLQVIT
jgi:hypothetical protein